MIDTTTSTGTADTPADTYVFGDIEVDNEIKFYMPPEPVGWWVLPGGTESSNFRFACHKKPNWLVRFSMKYVFGWIYEDAL
jgi:hypothetical protein